MKVKLLRKLRKNVKYVFTEEEKTFVLLNLKNGRSVNQCWDFYMCREKEYKMKMLINSMFELKYKSSLGLLYPNDFYMELIRKKEIRIADRKRKQEFLKYNQQ